MLLGHTATILLKGNFKSYMKLSEENAQNIVRSMCYKRTRKDANFLNTTIL